MRNPFSRIYSEEEQKIFDFLKTIPLFEKLTEKELSVFLPHLHERIYNADEVVFFRNDPSHALYIIKKGRVQLKLDINDSIEELKTLDTGSTMGENCILDGTKRPMNAYVISEKAHFYVIPRDSLMVIFDNSPEIKAKMMESFARMNETRIKKLYKFYRNSVGLFNLADIYSE